MMIIIIIIIIIIIFFFLLLVCVARPLKAPGRPFKHMSFSLSQTRHQQVWSLWNHIRRNLSTTKQSIPRVKKHHHHHITTILPPKKTAHDTCHPPSPPGKTPLRVNGGAQELLRCRSADLGLRGHAEAVRQPRTALAEASGEMRCVGFSHRKETANQQPPRKNGCLPFFFFKKGMIILFRSWPKKSNKYYKFFVNVLQRASIYIAVCVGKVFVSLVVGFVEGLPCMKKTISIYIGEEGWDLSWGGT